MTQLLTVPAVLKYRAADHRSQQITHTFSHTPCMVGSQRVSTRSIDSAVRVLSRATNLRLAEAESATVNVVAVRSVDLLCRGVRPVQAQPSQRVQGSRGCCHVRHAGSKRVLKRDHQVVAAATCVLLAVALLEQSHVAKTSLVWG